MSQQINLFNPAFRRKGFSLTSANAMLYGMGAVIALGAAYAAYAAYRLGTTERESAAVGSEYQNLTTQRDTLTAAAAARRPDAQLAAEVATLQSDLSMRTAIIDTLKNGALGTTMGYSEYMRAFSRQAMSGLWLTGFDISAAGRQLTLNGRTLSPDLLPDYLRRLNQESALQGSQFAALSISRPQPAAATGTAPAAAPSTNPANPVASTYATIAAALAPPDAAAAHPLQGGAIAAGQAVVPPAPVVPRYLEFTITTADVIPTDATRANP